MNKVIMTGRATKDIELKVTPSSTNVATFSVAVKRPFKDNESDFFECVAYGKTAELISKYIKKGDLFGIEGRLQARNYTNKEGRKVYVTEIIVENVEFLQSKKQETIEAPKFTETDPFANWEEIDDSSELPF